MELTKFKVTKFRSIQDSGWIDCDAVTTLIGINESGKTNLLLALWKLNPAKEGEIDALKDLPTSEYNSLRHNLSTTQFIHAEFKLSEADAKPIIEGTDCEYKDVDTLRVSRYYDGHYNFEFPNFSEKTTISYSKLKDIIECSINELKKSINDKNESKDSQVSSLEEYLIKELATLSHTERVSQKICDETLDKTRKSLEKESDVDTDVSNILNKIDEKIKSIIGKTPTDEETRKELLGKLPTFVYYSNYGNLTSQIYLPHAVKWCTQQHVEGIDNEDIERTVRVLFEYTELDPQELINLDEERNETVNSLKNPAEIERMNKIADKKAERQILLQSASEKLTKGFKNWWQQGEYKFRFTIDGKYFKIWVSDNKRPVEVGLENRSTGLQWFLSFFLVFLVEANESHKNAILLLDEAGLTLHPLAQKDLIRFFNSLSKENQIILTTHSPFLVDSNNVDCVRAVSVDNDGYTVVSSDLRKAKTDSLKKSVYAVHAALGLSVSDVFLQGCIPVIVEGPSDQYYLNAIKLYLIANGNLKINREIVFLPAGGVKGISAISSIVSGKHNELPFVILDGDKNGIDYKNKLTKDLYSEESNKIIILSETLKKDMAEIEDLIPTEFISKFLERLHLSRLAKLDDDEIELAIFKDSVEKDKAIMPQIENFARLNSLSLSNGWKVKMAQYFKKQMTNSPEIPKEYEKLWIELFRKLSVL